MLGILEGMSNSPHEGDQAVILAGPFSGKVGTLVRIGSESVTVMCNVFDRDIPVVISPDDVSRPPFPEAGGDSEPRSPLPSGGPAGTSAGRD